MPFQSPKFITTACRAALMLALVTPMQAAFATLPLQMTLADMVGHADHILIGRVDGVDMMDDAGRAVSDPAAMTGPCQDKTIRLRIKVERVLVTNAKQVPPVLLVPVDRLMHYSLGQVVDAHKGDRSQRLVILQGPEFQPVAEGIYFAAPEEKEMALRLYKSRAKKLVSSYTEEKAGHIARLDSDFCAGVRGK